MNSVSNHSPTSEPAPTASDLVLCQCTGARGRKAHKATPTTEYRVADRRCIIGSSSAADVRIDDSSVQPRHCVVERAPAGTFVQGEDGSIVVNGAPRDEAWLHQGDRLTIGSVELDICQLGFVPWSSVSIPRPPAPQAQPATAPEPESPSPHPAHLENLARAENGRQIARDRIRRLVWQLRQQRQHFQERGAAESAAEATFHRLVDLVSELEGKLEGRFEQVTASITRLEEFANRPEPNFAPPPEVSQQLVDLVCELEGKLEGKFEQVTASIARLEEFANRPEPTFTPPEPSQQLVDLVCELEDKLEGKFEQVTTSIARLEEFANHPQPTFTPPEPSQQLVDLVCELEGKLEGKFEQVTASIARLEEFAHPQPTFTPPPAEAPQQLVDLVCELEDKLEGKFEQVTASIARLEEFANHPQPTFTPAPPAASTIAAPSLTNASVEIPTVEIPTFAPSPSDTPSSSCDLAASLKPLETHYAAAAPSEPATAEAPFSQWESAGHGSEPPAEEQPSSHCECTQETSLAAPEVAENEVAEDHFESTADSSPDAGSSFWYEPTEELGDKHDTSPLGAAPSSAPTGSETSAAHDSDMTNAERAEWISKIYSRAADEVQSHAAEPPASPAPAPSVADETTDTNPMIRERTASVAEVLAKMNVDLDQFSADSADHDVAGRDQAWNDHQGERRAIARESAAPVASADAASASANNDGGVEDYMAELMRRLRPGASMPSATVPTNSTTASSSKPATPSVSELPVVPVEPLSEAQYVPIHSAPENKSHLDTLRQVANQSFQSAVSVSVRKRKANVATVYLTGGGAAFCFAGILWAMSDGMMDACSLGALFMLGLSLLCFTRFLISHLAAPGRLAAARPAEGEEPDAELQKKDSAETNLSTDTTLPAEPPPHDPPPLMASE